MDDMNLTNVLKRTKSRFMKKQEAIMQQRAAYLRRTDIPYDGTFELADSLKTFAKSEQSCRT